VLIVLALCLPSLATTRYIAATAGTFSGGVLCNGQTAITPATWNGLTLSAGDTSILCGTFSSTSATLLTVGQSGTSGNPITILFDTGTNITQGHCPSPLGCIDAAGVNWIVVDGGVNGLIMNTTNGTAGSPLCSAGPCSTQATSRGVYAAGCTNCVVKNLTVSDLYIHDPATNPDDRAPDQANMNAVYFVNTSNVTILNNTFHDCGWCINGWGNTIEIGGNNIYNTDHCVAFGPGADTSILSFHDNHCHDFANWDTAITPPPPYHHDGIHIFQDGTHTSSTIDLHNNLFDGDSGVTITAYVFTEGFISGLTAYNDVSILKSGRTMTGLWWFTNNSGGTHTSFRIFDNFFNGNNASICSSYKMESAILLTFQNNLLIGCPTLMDLEGTSTFASGGLTNNAYEDMGTDTGSTQTFNLAGSTTASFATWKAALPAGSGQDTNTVFNTLTNLKVSGTGTLSAGAPEIVAGLNLTPLGITALDSDTSAGNTRTPVARPNSAFDIGAYQFGAPPGVAPSPKLFVNGISGDHVNLGWQPSPTQGVKYTVHRGPKSGNYPVTHSNISGLSYTDTLTSRKTPYFYAVTAYLSPPCSKNCESVMSNEISVICCSK
jgi:hypothetical protein